MAENNGSFCRRFNKDLQYRRKFQLTCAVCSSYVVLGCVIVQIGTALPDLQVLVQVDLETISWLFTAWSAGYIVGSLASGVVYDRWNRLKYIGFSTIGCGLSSMVLPWSPSFPVMLVVRVATGWFCGAIDTGANTIVPSIWGNKAGPFMQALYLTYTVGGIVCPLLTRPFMTSDVTDSDSHSLETFEETSSAPVNIRSDYINFYNTSVNMHEQNVSRNTSYGEEIENIRIHFAFILIGAATLLTAVPYFVMSFLGNYDVRAKDNSVEIRYSKPKISIYRTCVIIVFVCIVNILYAATEDSIGAFLVTFSLYQLRWDKTKSVVLLALYWGASCLGGMIGVFVVRRLGLAKMTHSALFIWMSSFLCALICAQFGFNFLIWIFIPLSGMCMVVIIPNVISWTEAYVCTVSGKISSLIMMSTGIGIASNPPFIGHLMEKYSIMCFLYVIFIESVLCTACFVFAYLVLYCSNEQKQITETVEVSIEDEEKKAIPMLSANSNCIGEPTEIQELLSSQETPVVHEDIDASSQDHSNLTVNNAKRE